MLSQVMVEPRRFLRTLSCQTPNPVSSTAIFAKGSALAAQASAMAWQIESSLDCGISAIVLCAALARAIRSRTSWMDCRSLSNCHTPFAEMTFLNLF